MDLNLGLAPAIAFWLASALFSRGDEWSSGDSSPVLALIAVGLAEKKVSLR